MQYKKYEIAVPGSGKPCPLVFYGADKDEPVGRDRRHPALLICPGGGYAYTSPREAEPVALVFLARGFNVFVLRYHCAPEARWPVPQAEASMAMHFIRSHADETMTDPERVFICGFSAGGHLAASVGILWDRADWAGFPGIPRTDIRPTGMILCYPVITSGEKAHRGSFDNLLGRDAGRDMTEAVSLEKQVGSDTVPAFIWHTRTDASVPVENSLYLACALSEHRIPYEMHIFPSGRHGLSLANELTDGSGKGEETVPECAVWPDLAASWMLEEKWRS